VTTINVDKAYNDGTKKMADEHEAQEKTKVGILRGGTTGALLYGKTPIGQCARKAYLRYKGVQVEEIEDNRRLMFDAGLTNEDIWAKVLLAGLPAGYSLLREEEVPIRWEFTRDDGAVQLVTGRPDLVVVDPDGRHEVGIELKLASSVWTAKSILVDDKPKLVHALQAAHYSRILGIPWELWYTSRADFVISRESWMQALFKKMPAEYTETKQVENKKTGRTETIVNKVLPFRRGFRLWWQGDQVMFQRIGGAPAKPGFGKAPPPANATQHSVITWKSIEDFYRLVSNMETAQVLPPPPVNVNVLGKEEGYDICDYCPLKELCATKPKATLDEWMADVTGSYAVRR
jgi:hypothetical protein